MTVSRIWSRVLSPHYPDVLLQKTVPDTFGFGRRVTMEGKSKEEILKGYLWALKKMRPTLKTLFRAASKSVKDLNGLQLAPQLSFNMREVMVRADMLERY